MIASKIHRIPANAEAGPPTTEELLQLQAMDRPRPFVAPNQARQFAFACLVGLGTVTATYFLASRRIQSSHDAERELVEKIRKQRVTRAQAAPADTILPAFTPARTYLELVDRHKQSQQADSGSSLLQPPAREPMLEQELTERAKLFWNDRVTDVQTAIDALFLERDRRNAEGAIRAAKLLLESRGFAVHSVTM